MNPDERRMSCPDLVHHTACPSDYIGWHAWARKKSKTHKQVKCSGCGLYAIWVPKKSKPA